MLPGVDMRVRRARAWELALLPAIEAESGVWFRDVGMDWVADDPPMPVPTLAEFHRAGRVWVAALPEPVGFVLATPLDGAAHVDQLSVRPSWARRRIGAALLTHVGAWAAGNGLGALTLTTFRDVAWNAPYYARLGFRVLAPDEFTPGLAAVVAEESECGLDASPRVAMRRDLR